MGFLQVFVEEIFDYTKIAYVASWGNDKPAVGRGCILRPFRTPQKALLQLCPKPTNSTEFLKTKTLKFMDGGTYTGDLTIYTSRLTIEGNNLLLFGKLILDSRGDERFGVVPTSEIHLNGIGGRLGLASGSTTAYGIRLGDTTEAIHIIHNVNQGQCPIIIMDNTLIAGRIYQDDMTNTGLLSMNNTTLFSIAGTTMLDLTSYVCVASKTTLTGRVKIRSVQFPFENVLINNRFQLFVAPGSSTRPNAAFRNCVFAGNATDKTFQGPALSAIFDAMSNWSFKQGGWDHDASSTSMVIADTTTWF